MSTAAAPLVAEVFRSFDDVPAAAWTEVGAAPSVFMTRGWQRAWWEALGQGELLVVAVSSAGRTVALAPLFVAGGMAFLVGSGSADYLDFLARRLDRAALRLVLATAAAEVPGFAGFRFHHVPDASSTGSLLAQVSTDLGLRFFDEGWLDAPCLEATPAALAAATTKKSLVRHERWLAGRGALAVEHLTSEESVRTHLPDFFEQHRRRWATTPHPSLFHDGRQEELFRGLVRHGAPEGWLRFTRVTWEGRPIAFHLGFCHRSSYLWYKPSFDPDLAQRSPGEVLLRHLLLAAGSEGARQFDFGLGDEAFKSRFADRTRRVRTYGLYPPEVL